MSRKLTLVVFASTVIFRPLSWKTLHISFLILSISRGFPLKAARPSSWYKPMFWPYFLVRREKR